jgi:hypothetical protein
LKKINNRRVILIAEPPNLPFSFQNNQNKIKINKRKEKKKLASQPRVTMRWV